MDSNIIGKPHLQYVQDQIELRQKVLGKKSKTSSDITWMNGKTSWVKLTSGVNMADQDILVYNTSSSEWQTKSNGGEEFRQKLLDLPNYGSYNLADEMVLQGGVLNSDGSQKFGVSGNTSLLPSNTSNYGFSEFGAQAMPGIISFTSETTNKGSLRFANLQIRANNAKQFEYIEALYLSLGYTMLLEWGNSSYPTLNTETSSTVYETTNNTLSNEFIITDKQNAEGTKYFYTEIEKKRKESQGNYDGFLGKVTNFSWEYTKEGYYLISLKLITIGSVIESLKINVVQNASLYTQNKETFKKNQKENVLLTQLNSLSDPIRFGVLENPTIFDPYISPINFSAQLGSLLLSYVFDATNSKEFDFKSIKSEKIYLEYLKSFSPAFITEKQIDNASTTVEACAAIFGKTHFLKYVRFGGLLTLLNSKFLLYGTDKDNEPILFKLDTSDGKNGTTAQYGFSNQKSISSDPSKLIVRYKGDYLGDEIEIFNDDIQSAFDGEITSISNAIEPFHETIDGVDVCNIMNLYFSYDFLSSVINSNLDNETGSLDLHKFLKSLLNQANNLLGGVNKFNLRLVDKNFGTPEEPSIVEVIEFYDEVSPFEVNLLRKTEDEEPSLVVYGLGNEVSGSRDGSFVTEYQFKTEITNKLGNMLSIGAQANGQSVGEDATLFSKWNYGLVDRILPQKLDIDAKIKSTDQTTTGYLKLISSYRDYFTSFASEENTTQTQEENNVIEGSIVVDNVTKAKGYGFPNCNITPIESSFTSLSGFIETQKAFFQKYYALEAIGKKTATPFIGFVPVGFNLTLDGLSGIRIFDRLKIDSRFLPSNYGETLDFIITKLDHSIVNNKWSTKIGTMSVPKLSEKLNLDFNTILNTLPPVTTGFDDLVGAYEYKFSALATMIAQTVSIKANGNVTTDQKNTLNLALIQRLNDSSLNGIEGLILTDVLSTNGNLNLPTDTKKGESYQASPLVSIGSIKDTKYDTSVIFGLKMEGQDGSGNTNFRKYTSGLRLLSQKNNNTYYDGEYYLAQPAAEALYEFGQFIKNNWEGKSFLITSAYRSYNHQTGLKTADSSSKVAGAGTSAHGWGGAIDINELIPRDGNGKLTSNLTINQTFRTTSKAYAFWAEHAPKFGWYNPLLLRDGKGRVDEAWHWEFWGKPGQNLKLDVPSLTNNTYQSSTKTTVPTLDKNAALALNQPNVKIDEKTGKVTTV